MIDKGGDIKMKRLFGACGILLVLAVFSSCASAAAGQDGSSVWKVSRDGNTLFLGGSVHILRAKDFPLPGAFDRAFDQSAMLVLEADIDRMTEPEFIQYMQARMFLSDGQTLQTVLDADTYALLKEKCAQFRLPIENIERLKPSMAVNILTMLQIQRAGFIEQGVDSHYFAKARKAGKPLGFLETAESQVEILVTMGDGYENEYMRYALSEADMNSSEKLLAALVAEWKTGAAALTEANIAEMRQWPVLYQTLLVDRNAAWMSQLEQYLADEPVEFVIVGLAHLHGPDGLLRQLADSGYTVEQIR
jgi:uncharacterized protein YbaP (TraB family)